MPVARPGSRDWSELSYLDSSTREQLRIVFEVPFGNLKSVKKESKALKNEPSGTQEKRVLEQPKMVFILGPQSMGVLEITEVIRERANSFWDAKIYAEGPGLDPSNLRQAIATCSLQQQPMIILLDNLARFSPGPIAGSFQHWEDMIREVASAVQGATSNVTVVWPCTSHEISQLSQGTLALLKGNAEVIMVRPAADIKVEEEWLKEIRKKAEKEVSCKVDIQKLVPHCERLGYFDILTAFQRAARAAKARGSSLTTELVLEELASPKLEEIDCEAFEQAFAKLGSKGDAHPHVPTHTWSEIVGLDTLKITFHTMWEEVKSGKGNSFNTLLLWGTPGCGKTLFAQVAADVSGFRPLIKTGQEFIGKYVGWTSDYIRKFFGDIHAYSKAGPVLVFVDEADPLLISREMVAQEGTVFNKDAVETFLGQLGGFKPLNNVIFIASANYPHLIDDAVARRFNYRAFVGPPNRKGYEKLWKINLEQKARAKDIKMKLSDKDYEKIAELTQGRYLPSSISGPQGLIDTIMRNASGRTIDLAFVETAIRGYSSARDQMTIRKFENRRTELPDITPIVDDEELLQEFIDEHREELGLTSSAAEILIKDSRKAPYPTFKDVVGLWYQKVQVFMICEQLLTGEWPQKAPPVLLLWGPPGTGKTFFMKALANTVTSREGKKFEFHEIKGGQILSPDKLQEAFDKASGTTPSILYFEEAEAAFPQHAYLTDPTTLSFSEEVDGFTTSMPGVLVVLSTNRPWEIDKRVLSRVFASICFPLPSKEDLTKLWKALLENLTNMNTEKVDFNILATESAGIAPRNMRDICTKMNFREEDVNGKRTSRDELTTEDVLEYIRTTQKNIGSEEFEMFKLQSEYACVPVIDEKAAYRKLANRGALRELLGIDLREVASANSGTKPPEGKKIPENVPPIVTPVPPMQERFEVFNVVPSSSISEVSKKWLLERYGMSNTRGKLRADIHMKKGDHTNIEIRKVEIRPNDCLKYDEVRIAKSLITKYGISTPLSYEIDIRVFGGKRR